MTEYLPNNYFNVSDHYHLLTFLFNFVHVQVAATLSLKTVQLFKHLVVKRLLSLRSPVARAVPSNPHLLHCHHLSRQKTLSSNSNKILILSLLEWMRCFAVWPPQGQRRMLFCRSLHHANFRQMVQVSHSLLVYQQQALVDYAPNFTHYLFP